MAGLSLSQGYGGAARRKVAAVARVANVAQDGLDPFSDIEAARPTFLVATPRFYYAVFRKYYKPSLSVEPEHKKTRLGNIVKKARGSFGNLQTLMKVGTRPLGGQVNVVVVVEETMPSNIGTFLQKCVCLLVDSQWVTPPPSQPSRLHRGANIWLDTSLWRRHAYYTGAGTHTSGKRPTLRASNAIAGYALLPPLLWYSPGGARRHS